MVLQRRGLAGVTHRAVAAEAGVPLGSTTYHYANRLALLAAAMVEFIKEYELFIAEWAVQLDAGNVAAKLADLLVSSSTPGEGRARLLVEYELYLAAVREPELRSLSRRWDAALRGALQERLGGNTGRLYFAAYNGYVLESLISDAPLDRGELEGALGRIRNTPPTASVRLPLTCRGSER